MRRAKRRTGQAAHIGGRAEQQDQAACFASADGRRYFLVVADGMGGRTGGELAARTVIEVAERLWRASGQSPEDPPAFLEAICQQSHAAILQHAADCGEIAGATVVALLATPERAWWVHVGDSRLYAFREGKVVFRTEDHTLVQQLVRSGQIDEAAAGDHPEQHKLLRGLGGDDAPQTTHGQMRTCMETGFVLCTDGFWAKVTADEMSGLLAVEAPGDACAKWVETAVVRAGAEADNATVAVLQPAGGANSLAYRQLWPLYAAAAVALAAFLFHAMR